MVKLPPGGYWGWADLLCCAAMYDDHGRGACLRDYDAALVAEVERLVELYPEHADDRAAAARALLQARPGWRLQPTHLAAGGAPHA